MNLPSNPGILLPGFYMLFAMDANGVPSVARMVRVHADGAPMLHNPGDQKTATGTGVNLGVTLRGSAAGVRLSATGLPPGLTLDANTGVVAGTPSTAGRYAVTLTARNSVTSSSTDLLWTGLRPPT